MRLAALLLSLTFALPAAAQSGPIRCAGNDTLTVSSETIQADGVAVKALGNCRLELRDVTITSSASAAIQVKGNAVVTLTGGSITGDPAIDAIGNGTVYLDDTAIEGPIYRLGKAYVGARPAGETETGASLGSRRPSRAPVIEIDGLSLEVIVEGPMIRLSGETDLAPAPAPSKFEIETVIADLGAREEDGEWNVSLTDTVLFDFDAAEIQPDGAEPLAKLAYLIREKAGSEVVIVGHTDSKGTPEYNQALSERRALAVVVWLNRKGGIALDRMVARGAGEAEPVAANTQADGSDNLIGRALNRRVEISFANQ